MTAMTYGADATGSNYGSLPKGLQYAGYTTGTDGIAWSPAQFAVNPAALRICQDAGATDATADILDVEQGAATLADCPVWAKKALAAFRAATRPGQRSPAIYMSQSNVTSVVNALIAGGVTSGVGLFVADWNGLANAQAMLAKSSGPFPVIGVQYEDAGSYDLDVWLTSWLSNRSGKKVTVMQAPPGQWNDPKAWSWTQVITVGKGLDGNLHVFTFNAANGTWQKTE